MGKWIKRTAQSREPWRQGKGELCAQLLKAEGKEKHRECAIKIRSLHEMPLCVFTITS